MRLAEIDLWIGKTLFVPPIVKLCQITRQSQFAISRLFWFIVALDQLRVAETLASRIVAALFCVVMMITASLRADMPSFSMMGFRFFAMAFLALDVVQAVAGGQWRGVEIWLLVLIAEYAATIETIPPSEVRKTRAAKAAAKG